MSEYYDQVIENLHELDQCHNKEEHDVANLKTWRELSEGGGNEKDTPIRLRE